MRTRPLSANTLFHFTKSIDILESILTNEFYPHYSLEVWDDISGEEFRIAIPMVCFCDIPLSQIQLHTKTYGNYALGLTKNWGMKNSITPVIYTHRQASTRYQIIELLGKLYETPSYSPIMNLAYFMKPYEGKLYRDGTLTSNIRFYDEREWRYVPAIDKKEESIERHLSPDDFFNEVFKSRETKKLIRKKLSFEPKDIKYIIVESENEIYNMTDKIRKIKDRFPYRDVEVLITRIISMEHIRDDF